MLIDDNYYWKLSLNFDSRQHFRWHYIDNILQSISRKFNICFKITAMSIELSNFIEIALRHGCSPVNLLHIFRKPFSKNTSVWLLLAHHTWFNMTVQWLLWTISKTLNVKKIQSNKINLLEGYLFLWTHLSKYFHKKVTQFEAYSFLYQRTSLW